MTVAPFPDRVELVLDFALTDSGNADFFVREVDHTVLFDHTVKRWFRFEGPHWRVDITNQVQEIAVAAMRARQHEAMQIADKDTRKAAIAYALKSEDRRRIMDMLALASSRPTIAVDGSA